jgi:hypothetical protein
MAFFHYGSMDTLYIMCIDARKANKLTVPFSFIQYIYIQLKFINIRSDQHINICLAHTTVVGDSGQQRSEQQKLKINENSCL